MSEPISEPKFELPHASRVAQGFFFLLGIIAVGVCAFALIVLASSHQRAEAQERSIRSVEIAKGPHVNVAHVAVAAGTRTVTLPGEVHAWSLTTLYAKVAGFLQNISIDKGDLVQKGQILGRIQSPELDQAVLNAAADLNLKQVTAKREHELLDKKLAAQQDVDTADAQLKQSEATLASAKAMQRYEIIYSPFAGIVTNRYVDPGVLLPAATASTTSAQPVVDISDLNVLRIYTYLGQDDAALVRVGDSVHISMQQRPDLIIDAKVARVNHSLDARTRTMLVETDISNRKLGINPGEFVQVQLTLRARAYPVIPAEALIFKGTKPFVASITGGVVHLVAVETGQDNGRTVQIVSGLQGGEMLALNASTDVDEGTAVQVVEEK